MIGKLSPDALAAYVLDRTGATDPDVLVGPGYGEDAAAVSVDEGTLVVSADPISMATAHIGTLGVHVACNDVATSGADPRWLLVVALVPDDAAADEVTRQLDEAASSVGAAIVGGHTEYAPDRDRPLLSVTCLGSADRFVPTSGANPGESIIMTKAAGLEATAVLATDFAARLGLDDDVAQRAAALFDQVSVVPEARQLRDHATALHDPTEGGLVDGLLELARASGVVVEVSRSSIPVRPETADLCGRIDADPLRVFASGSLVASVPERATDRALAALEAVEVEATVIGEVRDGDESAVVLDGTRIEQPVRDDLYGLFV